MGSCPLAGRRVCLCARVRMYVHESKPRRYLDNERCVERVLQPLGKGEGNQVTEVQRLRGWTAPCRDRVGQKKGAFADAPSQIH